MKKNWETSGGAQARDVDNFIKEEHLGTSWGDKSEKYLEAKEKPSSW